MPVSPRYRVALGYYALRFVVIVLLVAHKLGLTPLLPGVEPGVVTGATVVSTLGVARLSRRGWRFLVGDDAA